MEQSELCTCYQVFNLNVIMRVERAFQADEQNKWYLQGHQSEEITQKR